MRTDDDDVDVGQLFIPLTLDFLLLNLLHADFLTALMLIRLLGDSWAELW